MKRAILAALLFSLSACGPAGNDPGPGGVTVDEAKALDEAAEMLDQRRLPQKALPQTDSADAEPRPAASNPPPSPTPKQR